MSFSKSSPSPFHHSMTSLLMLPRYHPRILLYRSVGNFCQKFYKQIIFVMFNFFIQKNFQASVCFFFFFLYTSIMRVAPAHPQNNGDNPGSMDGWNTPTKLNIIIATRINPNISSILLIIFL